MKRLLAPAVAVLCLCTGCLGLARKVERAARGEKGDRRDERERPRQAKMPQLDAVDLSAVSGHPRLFVGDNWPAATDEVSRDWQARLVKRADDTLDAKPIPFEPKKMLTGSREALRRISLLAGVYRFTGNKKYANAARREMANVCAFKHWQPDAFLTTAEMMTAVSIGYDWCHDALPAAERKVIVAALIRNGLQPAIEAYDNADKTWPSMRNNWNLVCNGGTIVAALAVAEEEPKLAQDAMDGAMKSIRIGMAEYDEHGGTVEGPMYHSYATRYLTFAAAAMKTALPKQWGLFHVRPVAVSGISPPPLAWTYSGDFRIAMHGSSGKVANFGDCGEYLGNSAWMLWLAKTANCPDYAEFQIAADRSDPSAFDLLWYSRPQPMTSANTWTNPLTGAIENQQQIDPLTGALFRRFSPGGNPTSPGIFEFGSTIVLRENFTDSNAAFVAVRTSSTAASHSHLDLGNFVYDVLGERFASDLGADSYDLPGYLHERRPDYLRTSTPGHNCLTFGEASQPLAAEAIARPIQFSGRAAEGVRVDLTDAYPTARRVERSFILEKRVLTLSDSLDLKNRTNVIWHLHTPAKVTLTKSGAVLDNNGKRVELRILSPAGAAFTAEPDVTEPPQLPVVGITHLRLKVVAKGDTEIRVEFRPVDAK